MAVRDFSTRLTSGICQHIWLSFTDAMICTKAAWDISPAVVPYCPTMQALYQMILDLQPTRAANFSADQFKAAGQPETEADNA